MRKLTMAAALAATLTLASPALAATITYSLPSDYSDLVNPNGPWSFTQGATALTHYNSTPATNSLDAATGNGFWGTGPSTFVNSPFVIKTTANGTAVSGGFGTYNNNDFLAGDVIAHSSNPGGAPLFINWTAPSAGSIDFVSAVWYAHSPVTRSNDILVTLGAATLGSATVNNAINRSNAITSLNGTGLTVAAGDVLSFRITYSAGQQFGSLTGINETIRFTPNAVPGVPEPATWSMLIAGFGLVGAAARRRRPRLAAA